MQLKAFLPAIAPTHVKECVLGSVGAALGLIGTELLCQYLFGIRPHWLIAPIGASAVLLFAAPASPLAQPWSLIVGNVLSALVGVTCAKLIGNIALASGLAVMLAIAVMLITRSLHPPGGAVALTTVIGGSSVTTLGYTFAVLPVAINSLLILLIALIYSRLTHRRYPNYTVTISPHQTNDPLPSQRLSATEAELAYALAHQDQLLDISPQDLQHVLHDAQLQLLKKDIGTLRCKDIMSKSLVTVRPESLGAEVWQKLSHHQVKALPVINAQFELMGIISLHDLLIDQQTGQMRTTPSMTEPAAQFMTHKVKTGQPEQALIDLVPLFSDGGLHHLPIVENQQLVGMITQSDMVAALFQWILRAKAPLIN